MNSPRDTVRRRMRGCRDRMLFIAINSALYEAADTFRAKAHQLISAGSVSGKNHQPSAPGEPPHRDSGTLQDHLETSQPKPLTGRVTSSADHAKPLEFGTSKMEARPYMRPAREAVKDRSRRLLIRRVNAALKAVHRRNRS